MPADLEPPELARVIDYAERSRAHDWSLRSALTRYGQGQPKRASEVLELVRRIEFAIHPHLKSMGRDGPASDLVLGLLGCMVELDRLGDVLAEWAGDPIAPTGERPDALVDATVTDVARRLEQLGVPREERQRPRGQRG